MQGGTRFLRYRGNINSGCEQGRKGCRVQNYEKYLYTSRNDSLLFGKRRDAQICSCSQKRVLQLVTLWPKGKELDGGGS